MTDLSTLISVKAVAGASVFAVLFIAERRCRAAAPPESPRRLVNNAGLWLLVLLASPAIVAPLTAFGANHVLWSREAFVGSGLRAAIAAVFDIVILDLWTYWIHRAYHQIPIMWRFHEIHHRDEFLDTTSAVRFHLGEVVLSALLRLVPIMALSMSLTSVLVFEALALTAALFHHSNLRLPAGLERGLSRVIVTPSIHWVHHHARRADTDSNYATIFSIWDGLFQSRSAAARRLDMKIGVENESELGFFELMTLPFMKSRP